MDTQFLESSSLEEIQSITLTIQITAAAVATSLLLIFIPNIETITFTAFILGYLFDKKFAFQTTIIMVMTWEIVASLVFAFSGVTFIFKLIAWLLVTSMGIVARKLTISQDYEFLLFGIISALLFDIIVTTSYAFFFLGQANNLLTIIISNFIFGAYFTLLHTIGNAFLFYVLPRFFDVIVPILKYRYANHIKIDWTFQVRKRHMKRKFIVISLIVLLFAAVAFNINQYHQIEGIETEEALFHVIHRIKYAGLLNEKSMNLTLNQTISAFDLLLQISIVNFTMYGSLAYVNAIDNIWENQNITNYYWFYYINGVRASIASSSYIIQDNVSILWAFEK